MLNHIVIMGRLTRDPELRCTNSGISVASFTLAVDRDYKGPDGEKQTDFIVCVAWRSTAEFVSKYFSKGRMAVVAGALQSRRWQDKQGADRISWEVIAENVYFGDSKREDSAAPAPVPQSQYPSSPPMPRQTSLDDFQEIEDDDLPF